MDIQWIAQADIDRLKWDSCVHYAQNGNVFGYKWFLNNVTKDWDALVEGDYESVFPLTWQKNIWGNKVLQQPILARELGIYSIHLLSAKRIAAFLDRIPSEYKKATLAFNEQMLPVQQSNNEWKKQSNYQLFLQEDYSLLREKYDAQLLAALSTSHAGLNTNFSLKPERLADFFNLHSQEKNKTLKYHALLRIMYNALHRGLGFAAGVSDEKDNLLAAGFFIYGHGKLLNLVSATSKEGKRINAFEILLDMIIQSNAGRPLIFDFNSNDKRYAWFGALPNHFYEWHHKF